ncbi:MAG TPA: DUF3794 domain-containing protein [Firmicutes bacterium]|nr:DUF3794 domain-containing protein [Bacillota bacterium]
MRRVEWPGALPFDIYVDVVGAEPEMAPEARARLLLCEWEVRPGQYALDLDLILAVTAAANQTLEYAAICGANIGREAQLFTEEILLNPITPPLRLALNRETSGILELPAEAPPPANVLDVTCRVSFEKEAVNAGQVVLVGAAGFDLIYEAEDLTVHQIELGDALEFEFRLEDDRIEPQMSLAADLVTRCQSVPVNGGKSLRLELQLKGTVDLFDRREVIILSEISATGSQVETRKEFLSLDNFVSEKSQQGTAQGLLEIGQQYPPIRELLRCSAVPNLTDYFVDQDKIVLEGTFDLELIYLAHSEEDVKPLYRGVFAEAISFQQTVVVPGLEPGMQPHIVLETVKTSPDLINRETVEIILTFRAAVTTTEYLEVEAVVEAVEVEPPLEDPPTLTYVFVQKGDTVWKLARQYHTDEEAILEANPFLQQLPDLLKPGDKIYIPRG